MNDIYLKVKFKSDITNEQLRDIIKHSVGAVIVGRSVVSYARYYRSSGNVYFVFRTNINSKIAKDISNIKIQHFLEHPKIIASSIMWIKEVTLDPKIKFVVE